jgi:uncharacterized protein DUF6916
MLEQLTLAAFQDQLGKVFRLDPGGGAPGLNVALIEARDLTRADSAPGPRRSPFSLVFLGPPGPILPQRIYPLTNDAMGRLEIFLVPIGSDANGVQYEAIFN